MAPLRSIRRPLHNFLTMDIALKAMCDAPIGSRFEPILSIEVRNEDRTPIFGPANRRLDVLSYPETVFRKRD